jgi:hypothetical protein
MTLGAGVQGLLSAVDSASIHYFQIFPGTAEKWRLNYSRNAYFWIPLIATGWVVQRINSRHSNVYINTPLFPVSHLTSIPLGQA